MPDWGSKFHEAWRSASDAGREAASRIATGAATVGQQALRTAEVARDGALAAARIVRDGTVAAAEFAAEKTAQAGQWALDQGQRAALWAYESAKSAIRGGLKAIADPIFTGMSVARDVARGAADKVRQIAQSVSNAVDSIGEMFGISKPAAPVASCPNKPPVKDADFDGALIGADCKPLTAKGDDIDSKTLANAEANAVVSDSPCCEGKRASGAATGSIVYVNGINTTREGHCQTLRDIADQTCKKVYGVYNATQDPKLGSFSIEDTLQTSKDRRLIRQAMEGKEVPSQDGRNPAVDTLARLMDAKSEAEEPLEVWAHSQGGAVTSLALFEARKMGYLQGRDNPLENFTVKSFGAAAPAWPDGANYEHYVHINDATPFLFGLGDDPAYDLAHAGAGAKVVRFSGEPGGEFQEGDLDRNFLPHPTKYHGIDTDGYLRMQKFKNGGCP